MTITVVPALSALGTSTCAAIGRHLDLAFRAMIADGRRVEGPHSFRLLTGEPHPFGNFALLSAPADLDAVRDAVEPLVAAGVPAAVIFPDLNVPARVDAYLTERGFASHGAMPAMGVDIADLPPTSLPDGYEFVPIDDDAGRAEWIQQFAIGYELPVGVAQCFLPVATPAPQPALRLFAVRRQGAIVCTSACYLDNGLAGIYCVSTVPEERRKGLGAHATVEPLRRAAQAGYRVGILQSSEAGHGVYRKLGFVDFGGVPLFVRIPGHE